MEQEKIDKRSKEYKALKQTDNKTNETAAIQYFEHLFKLGLPVSQCTFHSAVNNADNVPESQFNESSENKSRKVEMSLQPNGSLLCRQKGKYFFVGQSTVNFGKFKV